MIKFSTRREKPVRKKTAPAGSRPTDTARKKKESKNGFREDGPRPRAVVFRPNVLGGGGGVTTVDKRTGNATRKSRCRTIGDGRLPDWAAIETSRRRPGGFTSAVRYHRPPSAGR